LEQPIGLLGTPQIGFFSLIIIGGLAGWIGGMVVGVRHWIVTNILIGIVGSWLGSKVADLANISVDGSIAHFLAALVGSIVVLALWQMFERRSVPAAPTR
jgi:uncharacterized membrane protein YeaQ/YmgE (transglycosylase-associated protein family)